MYKKIIRPLDSSSNILEHEDLSQPNELLCHHYPLFSLYSGINKT